MKREACRRWNKTYKEKRRKLEKELRLEQESFGIKLKKQTTEEEKEKRKIYYWRNREEIRAKKALRYTMNKEKCMEYR